MQEISYLNCVEFHVLEVLSSSQKPKAQRTATLYFANYSHGGTPPNIQSRCGGRNHGGNSQGLEEPKKIKINEDTKIL